MTTAVREPIDLRLAAGAAVGWVLLALCLGRPPGIVAGVAVLVLATGAARCWRLATASVVHRWWPSPGSVARWSSPRSRVDWCTRVPGRSCGWRRPRRGLAVADGRRRSSPVGGEGGGRAGPDRPRHERPERHRGRRQDGCAAATSWSSPSRPAGRTSCRASGSASTVSWSTRSTTRPARRCSRSIGRNWSAGHPGGSGWPGRVRDSLRAASAGLPDGPRGLLPGLVDGDTTGLESRPRGAVPGRRVDPPGRRFRHELLDPPGCGAPDVAPVRGPAGRSVPRCRRGRAGGVRRRGPPVAQRAARRGDGRHRPRGPGQRTTASGDARTVGGRHRACSSGIRCSLLTTGSRCRSWPRPHCFVIAPGWAQMPCGAAAFRRSWRRRSLWLPRRTWSPCPSSSPISGRVSLVAVPANVLAEPVVAVGTVARLLRRASGAVVVSARAQVLAQVAGWPCRWLVRDARLLRRARRRERAVALGNTRRAGARRPARRGGRPGPARRAASADGGRPRRRRWSSRCRCAR